MNIYMSPRATKDLSYTASASKVKVSRLPRK